MTPSGCDTSHDTLLAHVQRSVHLLKRSLDPTFSLLVEWVPFPPLLSLSSRTKYDLSKIPSLADQAVRLSSLVER